MTDGNAVQVQQQEERDQLISQLIEVNAGRAAYYRMLGELFFRELTQEQVEHLAGMDFAGMDGGDELIAQGYDDMRRYLRHVNSGTRQALACDYAHTFLAAGNYETFAATPFESVFTSQLGLMMQEARDDVYRRFCEARVAVDEGLRTPEDHLSFEFEFMAAQAGEQARALHAGDTAAAASALRTQREFHRDHLLNWIDAYCDCLQSCAQTRFYRGVAKLTRGFVHMDEDMMDDAAETLC